MRSRGGKHGNYGVVAHGDDSRIQSSELQRLWNSIWSLGHEGRVEEAISENTAPQQESRHLPPYRKEPMETVQVMVEEVGSRVTLRPASNAHSVTSL